MKNKGNNNAGNQTGQPHRNRPDVRDNLDSRKKEEQESKGDDITHNRKPHHNKQPRTK